jgi:hypothetical protein
VSTTTEQVEEKAPHPATVEGQIFLYTPEQAAPHLRLSPLQIKRKISRREIAFTPSGGKGGGQNYLTGRQICEHIASVEVRPLDEKKRSRSKKSAA